MKKDNKTIAITLRFWTDNLPAKVGKKSDMTPMWSSGMVVLEGNKTKGLKAQVTPFNSLENAQMVIKKVLMKNKIVLVVDSGRSLREDRRSQ
jgi:hypothetical protein